MGGIVLESILVVFQNPREGALYAYDDWYTNVHIRDALRIPGAIATQRFIVHDRQPVLDGRKVTPFHWAHTIYEWESAAASVQGHNERAATPLMEISRDCSFTGLRDYFYRPEFLSHGWSPETGFRRGDAVLTAMIVPRAGSEEALVRWFAEEHAPATLTLPGFGSAGLFSLHEEQSLPTPTRHRMVAIYGLTDAQAALGAWGDRHDRSDPLDLSGHVDEVEASCWQKRIDRLRADDVLDPSAEAAAEERRARLANKANYLTGEELAVLLSHP